MSTNITDQSLSTIIKSRHSVRSYDANFKISKEELTSMIAEATLAPSSSNLQPWRFLMITDQDVKEKLFPIAYQQKPVLEASAVAVLLGDTQAYEFAEKIYDIAIAEGISTVEVKERLVAGVNNTYPHRSKDERADVAYIDGGLIAMQLMLIAKARGYDTLPMGGFDREKVMELFEIPDRYVPVMLIAIGKANAEAFKTVRLPLEDVLFWNSMK